MPRIACLTDDRYHCGQNLFCHGQDRKIIKNMQDKHIVCSHSALPPMCHFRSTRLPVSIDCRQILAETTFVKIWWNSSTQHFSVKVLWLTQLESRCFFYKHGLTSLTTIRQRPWPTWHQLTHSEVGVFWVPKKDIRKKPKRWSSTPCRWGRRFQYHERSL